MITVTLPYPPSANHYKELRVVTPRGKPAFVQTYLTKEAVSYKEQVGWILRAAGVKEIMRGRVRIDLVLFANRPLDWQTRMRKLGAEWDNTVRRLDLDNARKCVYDSLKNIAFEDDFWVWKDSGEVGEPDGLGARVVVRIGSAAKAQPQAALFA